MVDYNTILFLLALVAGFTIWILKNKSEAINIIKGFLLDFAIRAEYEYNLGGTGIAKKALVKRFIFNSDFYKSLPGFIKPFITDAIIDKIIDTFISEVFNKLKETNVSFANFIEKG